MANTVRDDLTSRKFAGNLQRLVDASGMTQKGLAKATGLSQVTIWRYLNAVRTPSIRALARLCKALGCSADKLLEGV